MRVFVAGATGVLGRRAVPVLVAAGHEVTALVRSPEKAELARSLGAAPVEVSLFDPRRVARRGRRPRRGVQPRDAHPAGEPCGRPAGVAGEQPHPLGGFAQPRGRGPRGGRDALRAGVDRVPLRRPRRRVDRRVDRGDRRQPVLRSGEGGGVRGRRVSQRRAGAGVVLRFGEFVAPDSDHTLTILRAAAAGSRDRARPPGALVPDDRRRRRGRGRGGGTRRAERHVRRRRRRTGAAARLRAPR